MARVVSCRDRMQPALVLTKAVAQVVADVAGFRTGNLPRPKEKSELPLSVVRWMPRLTALHIDICSVPRDSLVWSELGGLRELSVYCRGSSLPPALLSHVGQLRSLHLHLWSAVLNDVVLYPGLSAVPLLESLSLGRFSAPSMIAMSTTCYTLHAWLRSAFLAQNCRPTFS